MENLVAEIRVDDIDAQYQEEMNEKKEKSKKYVKYEKFEFDEKNYLDTRIEGKGPQEKTITIRLLPFTPEGGSPFKKIRMHTVKVPKEVSKSGYKSYVCLKHNHGMINESFGEACPFCELVEKAREEQRNASTDVLKKKYGDVAYFNRVQDVWIVRLIERGKESEGVKFWKFSDSSKGDGIYDKLMNLFRQRLNESRKANGKDYNIFSLYDGRDLTLTIRKNEQDKYSYNFVDSVFSSAIGNETQIVEWVTDKKKWSDVYAVKTYDYLSVIRDDEVPFFDKAEKKWIAKSKTNTVKTDVPDAQDVTSPDFSDFGKNTDESDMGARLDVDADPDDMPF